MSDVVWNDGPRYRGRPSFWAIIDGVKIIVRPDVARNNMALYRTETTDGRGKGSDTIDDAKAYAPYLAALSKVQP